MKHLAFVAALTVAIAAPVAALSEENEGRQLAELAFKSIDGADRGFIDLGGYTNFGTDVFVSMDGDDSGKISLAEFMGWGYGMQPLAEKRDRADAYETALRVVFAFWDRNGDNQISKTEHRQSLISDFRRADTDNDAVLTEAEFLSGFSVMVALRAAINPAPIE